MLIGYALGSVPVALIVARRHGVDLRRTGDGNPGAWNALEQLGGARAAPAFLGDGFKGTLAGLVGALLAGFTGAWLGVLGAMLGHAFPPQERFRGGKSVMTFVGGMFVIAPVAALLSLAICTGTSAATRSFAYGARAGVVAVVPLQLLLDGAHRTAATGALMCVIGALFLLRRSAPATSGPDAARSR